MLYEPNQYRGGLGEVPIACVAEVSMQRLNGRKRAPGRYAAVVVVVATGVLCTASLATAIPCSLTCPADITENTNDPAGVVINYPPTKIDGTCGTIVQVQGLPSGALFSLGVTKNTFADESSPAFCTFSVTVLTPRASPALGNLGMAAMTAMLVGLGVRRTRRPRP